MYYTTPPLLVILQVLYGYLMYVEFGIGEWLEKRPFLYSLTHEVYTKLVPFPNIRIHRVYVTLFDTQISCFTAPMFLTALAGKGWLSWEGLFYGLLCFYGFFSFDICRKLDPYLPKVLLCVCVCEGNIQELL